jgi:hypothetical protein
MQTQLSAFARESFVSYLFVSLYYLIYSQNTNSTLPQPRSRKSMEVMELDKYFNPALCANTEQVVDGEVVPCQNATTQFCASCKLVQVWILLS